MEGVLSSTSLVAVGGRAGVQEGSGASLTLQKAHPRSRAKTLPVADCQ